MPAQGALVRAADHNNVFELERNSVARLLNDRINIYPPRDGGGIEIPANADTGTFGYGQALLSSGVNLADVVEAGDIAALKSDMLKIARHIGVESNPLITALPSIAPGDEIQNEHLSAFEAALQLLVDNRFEVALGQYSVETFATDISHSRTTPWGNNNIYGEGTVEHAFTVDFGSSEAARYFFNSGGQIRFTASRTGGVNGYQDQVWTSMLNSMGLIIFNHNSTNGESGINSSVGFYQLTNSPRLLFTKGAGSVYVYSTEYLANDYSIYASCNVPDNKFGEARYVFFRVYFNDDHAANLLSNDQVTGTLTSTIRLRRATGPNVEVPLPVAVNTRLLSF